MKQELSFFEDRIGYNVWRDAVEPKDTGIVAITSKSQALELYNDQVKLKHAFTKCGVLIVIGAHVSIRMDGRNIKCVDYMATFRSIKNETITIANPEKFPAFYRKMYDEIIAARNQSN